MKEWFSFNNDHDWDEIVHSYGFTNIGDNYGRFGSQRAQNEDDIDTHKSAASMAMDDILIG